MKTKTTRMNSTKPMTKLTKRPKEPQTLTSSNRSMRGRSIPPSPLRCSRRMTKRPLARSTPRARAPPTFAPSGTARLRGYTLDACRRPNGLGLRADALPEVNTYTSSADASTAATEDMIATKTTRLRRCTRRRSTARARYRSGFEYARASASPNDANATSSQRAPAQLSPLPSSESALRASSSLREGGELAAFATAG